MTPGGPSLWGSDQIEFSFPAQGLPLCSHELELEGRGDMKCTQQRPPGSCNKSLCVAVGLGRRQPVGVASQTAVNQAFGVLAVNSLHLKDFSLLSTYRN